MGWLSWQTFEKLNLLVKTKQISMLPDEQIYSTLLYDTFISRQNLDIENKIIDICQILYTNI